MLRIKPEILFDFITGETFKIIDETGIYDAVLNPTGWGTPNIAASDVNAVRVIFSTYLKEQTAAQNVTDIEAGVEYEAVGTGSFVFDTKTYNAGDTFICMTSGTPTLPATIVLNETGRFQPVTDFVPTDQTSDDFTPSLLGIDDTTFPDTVGSLQMDIYTTSYSPAAINVPAGTYLVYGTAGQTVVISGVTYRVGEVFTQGGLFSFTGTASIALYNNTTIDADGNPQYVYFLCGYYALQSILELSQKLADSCCGCKDKVRENYTEAMNLWISISNELSVYDGQVDISGTQIKLEQIFKLNAACQC